MDQRKTFQSGSDKIQEKNIVLVPNIFQSLIWVENFKNKAVIQ